MATKGSVVAGVVLGFIFLIIIIVLLATSAGSKSGSGGSPTGAPGSAGNWTAAQVAEQVRLFGAGPGAKPLTELGLSRASVDRILACFMESASNRYGYDYMNACNTSVGTCQPNADDIRAIDGCMGGERGKWSAEMKSNLEEAVKRTMTGNPGALAGVQCIIAYVSSNYSYSDLMAEVGKGKSDNIDNAGIACALKSIAGPV